MKRFLTILCSLALVALVAASALGRPNDGKVPGSFDTCVSGCKASYNNYMATCNDPAMIPIYTDAGYSYEQCTTDALVSYIVCVTGCWRREGSLGGGFAP